MERISKIFENSIDNILSIEPRKALRIVIIVGAYMLFRNLVTRDQNRRQLARQVRQEEERKKEEREKTLLERPEDFEVETIAKSSTTEYGWGKKTRQRVKRQQEVLERAVDDLKRHEQLKLSGTGYDSDEEIEELLED
ncbi:uncharacterized protein GVI51_J05533 [Nakaseomyces glabratus]|uniref:Processing of GAS1 and ALP protein 2 n=2 Tax=Candida glabrata TaxID=5478 RepID=Q6FP90_CANGA|nr:uncharacterized protein CAGL0J05720g [Nakaseomyces glabratus]KAH7583559.1 hypothetical protein J7296_03053 [Nakaseomyces glabratus]KAH7584049.1 hypothetical protein J7298_03247 [Nakaseomyces glabratus]KAH7585292.1 hypothetical protein J7297_03254 [Nakaseomyces glabratus]KAH7597793.1 hypothetical protein J7295_03251 [Nakaseomyces glabratus]KAH7598371.1 hypothetical protein J7294_03241 [Nakaseomyces glabratus]|eukprot:XP_447954.1 uncharacterized protein CAGL0J05720g [[Candida] glabrata]